MPDVLPPSSIPAPLLVYGLGRSGRGVLRFLSRNHLSADWTDARPSDEDLQLAAELGFARAATLQGYRTVIAAPGVPIDHPDLQALRDQGAEVIGEAELARCFYPHLPMVGITGTAGKGSTTVLVAELLRGCGLKALEGGNIDPPLLDIIDKAEVAVIELSSFQLERVSRFRPEVAVITNLGVDHLDRHRTEGAYHAAKLNITAQQTPQDVLIAPPGLDMATRARRLDINPSCIGLEDGTQVLPLDNLPEGIHPANAAAAVLAAESLLRRLGRAVDPAQFAATLRQASPVSGRFETVARLGNVRFINDSIATRTLAVKAALEQAPAPIAWLVGGRDKGAELEPLIGSARGKVKVLIAFGEDGPQFAQALSRELDVPQRVIAFEAGQADPMPQAVKAAYQALGGEGSVLLAPIGTSFDLYRDYAARGAAFTQAAHALCQQASSDQADNHQASGKQEGQP